MQYRFFSIFFEKIKVIKRGKRKIIVKELKMIPTEFGDQVAEVNLNDIELLYKDFNIDPESAKVQVSGMKTFLGIANLI